MPTITMRRLGRMGRWGNQVFQYMFLRTYARRYSLDYQAPHWEGQRLFGLNDPPLGRYPLPRYFEEYDESVGHSNIRNYQEAWRFPIAPNGKEVVGYDYHGYCQFHTSYYAPTQQFLWDVFTPLEKLQKKMVPALQKLRQKGQTIVGLHLRRGDTGRAIFYLTPNSWYRNWLEENWSRLDNPVLFVASEEPSDVESFGDFNPVSSPELLELSSSRYALYNYLRQDLKRPTPQSMDWFPDWYLLTQCNVLLFGESTFSFSAAMMNRQVQECWQSKLSTQQFHLINPWNAHPLVKEHLEDYPDIPGTHC